MAPASGGFDGFYALVANQVTDILVLDAVTLDGESTRCVPRGSTTQQWPVCLVVKCFRNTCF
jgi:hypothetical protein